MNLLFLSLLDFHSIKERGIYTDLMSEFSNMGNNIYIVSPFERKNKGMPGLIKEEENVEILKVKIGNTQKTNIIEKGVSTLMLEYEISSAVKKYWSNVPFDIILYATPPITFEKVIRSVEKNLERKFKKRALTYLMLKDIFPQNAVDLKMFEKNSPIYWYFREKEKRLYKISDYIGCMSPENCRYLLRHNPYIKKERVEVLPNAVKTEYGQESTDAKAARAMKEKTKYGQESADAKAARPMVEKALRESRRKKIREKYGISKEAMVFLYGGNLGKPQDIGYIIRCLKANEGKADRFFLICGSGTEYDRLDQYYQSVKGKAGCNFKLISQLPREEYDMLPMACDVGLIFLDARFTIPNFPSRLLSYMEAGIPVLAATDSSTDLGRIITENGFGFWCESSSVENFSTEVEKIILKKDRLRDMGERGKDYLFRHFTAKQCVEKIMRRYESR